MGGLSREAQALVEIARKADTPCREDRDRVGVALAATLAAGGAACVASTALASSIASTSASASVGTGAAAAGAGLLTVLGPKVIMTMFVAGVVGGAVALEPWSRETSPVSKPRAAQTLEPAQKDGAGTEEAAAQTATTSLPASPATPAVLVVDGREHLETREIQALKVAPRTAAAADEDHSFATVRSSRRIVSRKTPPPTVDLSTEIELIRDADTAHRAGDANGALVLLSEHSRRFPEGAMSIERDVLRILALCDVGRFSEARDAADRFLARHAGSPQARRIRAGCVAR